MRSEVHARHEGKGVPESAKAPDANVREGMAGGFHPGGGVGQKSQIFGERRLMQPAVSCKCLNLRD